MQRRIGGGHFVHDFKFSVLDVFLHVFCCFRVWIASLFSEVWIACGEARSDLHVVKLAVLLLRGRLLGVVHLLTVSVELKGERYQLHPIHPFSYASLLVFFWGKIHDYRFVLLLNKKPRKWFEYQSTKTESCFLADNFCRGSLIFVIEIDILIWQRKGEVFSCVSLFLFERDFSHQGELEELSPTEPKF